MDITPEESKKALEKRTPFGFVPHRLEIAGLPKFNNFPFSVLFMSNTIRDGQQISATALYEPEFSTHKQEGGLSIMRYRNVYGGDCHLRIGYDDEKKRHHGEKFVNGRRVGIAYGDDWNTFFVRLTMLGLTNGEQVEFGKTE